MEAEEFLWDTVRLFMQFCIILYTDGFSSVIYLRGRAAILNAVTTTSNIASMTVKL
jgi:hypothetical protein